MDTCRRSDVASRARGDEITPADEFFVNLDGSILEDDGTQWRIDVCGVHSDNARHWVQVNLRSHDECGVTVTTDHLDVGIVRGILLDWLRNNSNVHVCTRVVSAAHA